MNKNRNRLAKETRAVAKDVSLALVHLGIIGESVDIIGLRQVEGSLDGARRVLGQLAEYFEDHGIDFPPVLE